jgi:RimJ/RimL family protein N-acetyltransferase
VTQVLKTKRLELRAPLESDAEALTAALNNYEVTKWLAKVPNPYTESDALAFIAMNEGKKLPNYHIFQNEDLIGGIGLGGLVGLGYWLVPAVWGKGIATEASAALLDRHFENVDAAPILSGYLADNVGSAKVQKKLGFRVTGRSMVTTVLLGEVPHVDTQISRMDWIANQSKLKETGGL